MKVVLAALNAKYTHSSLALRYLSKAARGFDHEAVEYNINQDLAQIAGDLSGGSRCTGLLLLYLEH